MKSINFPEMFTRTSTNIVEDYDATLQNLKLLVYSEKGELFGDPYYGTGLKRYLYDQNDVVLQDILLDDLFTAIKLFMPQLQFERKDIKLIKDTKGALSIKLQAMNKADFTTDVDSIVLMDAIA